MTTTEPTRPGTIPLPHRSDRRQGAVLLTPPGSTTYRSFAVAPVSPTIGAEVTGLDLGSPLTSEAFDELRHAFLTWKVLFFRDQDLTAEQQVAFAQQWGEIEQHPFIPSGDRDTVQRFEKGPAMAGYENEWHHDNTWREHPSFGAVLRAVEVPPVGGDTLFCDMAAAYDNLGDDVKARIDGLEAEHDWIESFGFLFDDTTRASLREQYPTVRHPVVRTHPETGARMLFVNANFTRRIVGLAPDESWELLEHLWRQADRPEYQCRFRWQPGSVAFWDNRAVQHYAASDYWPQRRLMERVAIVGDRPF